MCSEDDSGHDGSVQRLGKWAADRHAGLAHTPYETLDSCSDYTHAKVSAKGRMHAANTFGVLTDITRRGYPAESEAPTTCRWKHAIVRWVEEAGRADRYAQATLSELYWGVLTGRKKRNGQRPPAACGPWPRSFLGCAAGWDDGANKRGIGQPDASDLRRRKLHQRATRARIPATKEQLSRLSRREPPSGKHPLSSALGGEQ